MRLHAVVPQQIPDGIAQGIRLGNNTIGYRIVRCRGNSHTGDRPVLGIIALYFNSFNLVIANINSKISAFASCHENPSPHSRTLIP
jgi:hypothetical protein